MAATRLFLWILLIGCVVVSESSMREVHISDAMRGEFNSLDKDRNGVLTAEELLPRTKAMGLKLSEEELQEQIAAVDKDNSGTVDQEEFIELAGLFNTLLNTLVNTLVQFKSYDKNGDGFITLEELKKGLPQTARHWSDEDIEDMIKKHDLDGNGQLNFAEFDNLWKDTLRVEVEKSANQNEEVGKLSKSRKEMTPKAMRGEFDSLDVDKNGELTLEELRRMTEKMRLTFTEEELQERIAAVDKDKNKTVDREEFVDLIITLVEFKSYDKNGDKFITHEELKQGLPQTARHWSDAVIEDMIKKHDLDGNGQLNFAEFVNLWKDTLRAEEEKSANQKEEARKLSKSIIKEVHISEDMRDEFESFDVDKNGALTVEEFGKLTIGLGFTFTDKELEQMLETIDVDENGTVELNELGLLMTAKLDFDHYDKNGDHFITHEELKQGLPQTAGNWSDAQIQDFFDYFDLDGDKQLNFMEFVAIWRASEEDKKEDDGKSSNSIMREVHISEEIRGAFKSLDSDGTASITPEELGKLMEKWGLKLSDAELKQIIEKADKDRNNAVELEEFVDLISEIAKIMFKHLDQNGDGFLTCEELKKWTVVKPMSDEEIQKLISQYDSDGDKQKLNQEEFVKLMTAMLQEVDENSA